MDRGSKREGSREGVEHGAHLRRTEYLSRPAFIFPGRSLACQRRSALNSYPSVPLHRVSHLLIRQRDVPQAWSGLPRRAAASSAIESNRRGSRSLGAIAVCRSNLRCARRRRPLPGHAARFKPPSRPRARNSQQQQHSALHCTAVSPSSRRTDLSLSVSTVPRDASRAPIVPGVRGSTRAEKRTRERANSGERRLRRERERGGEREKGGTRATVPSGRQDTPRQTETGGVKAWLLVEAPSCVLGGVRSGSCGVAARLVARSGPSHSLGAARVTWPAGVNDATTRFVSPLPFIFHEYSRRYGNRQVRYEARLELKAHRRSCEY